MEGRDGVDGMCQEGGWIVYAWARQRHGWAEMGREGEDCAPGLNPEAPSDNLRREQMSKGRFEANNRQKRTYQSPPPPRPSPRPALASRLAFWPAAAEAKLDGRFEGMLTGGNVSTMNAVTRDSISSKRRLSEAKREMGLGLVGLVCGRLSRESMMMIHESEGTANACGIAIACVDVV